MAGKAWGAAVRARASELSEDRELGVSDVKRALMAELGAPVPIDTVSRWVREARLKAPTNRGAVLSDAADRAAWLISSELTRLERQTAKTRDLQRLEQAVRTLKTLQSIEPSKPGAQRQTLADLSERGAATAGLENPALQRAA